MAAETAASTAGPEVAAPAPAHRLSLTLDPTYPLIGMGMVNAELLFPKRAIFPGQPVRDVSIAGWVGLGRVRMADGGMLSGLRPAWGDCDDLLYCDRGTVVWVGGQAIVYAVGTFQHGLQIGVEASFMRVWGTRRYNSFSDDIGQSIAKARGTTWSGTPDREFGGNAFMPGAVMGYKLVTKSGFTVNPQLAADVVISSDSAKIQPRLALNAGWSF